MLENIKTVAAIVFITIGVFFAITSVIGVFKFKYVLNRMHSAAMGDTLAILFVLIGLVILCGFNFTSLKLLAIILFFLACRPGFFASYRESCKKRRRSQCTGSRRHRYCER